MTLLNFGSDPNEIFQCEYRNRRKGKTARSERRGKRRRTRKWRMRRLEEPRSRS
jgi:hypothetical protein